MRLSSKRTLKALAEELGVKPYVLAGVKVMKGWTDGTRLTKAELKRALDEFMSKAGGER